MKYRSKRSAFFPIGLLIAILLTVINITAYIKGSSSIIGNTFATVAAPVKTLFSIAETKLAEIPVYFISKKALNAENQALKKEKMLLERQNSSLLALKDENKWLYNFLDLKKSYPHYTMTYSRIISKFGPASNSFTLNSGSEDGLKKGMPVVSEDLSLIGIVTETGNIYSRAVTAISSDFSLGVYIERTGQPAILSGSYEYMSDGLCVINNLPSDADIVIGDSIYTSGVSKVIPTDLYVGKVCEIVPDAGQYTLSAVVMPDTLSEEIDRVMVISSFERIYE